MQLQSLTLSRLTSGAIGALTLGLVLLVLPATEDFVTDSKMYLLFVIALVLGLLFAASIISRKSLTFVASKTTVFTALFTLAIAAATFFTNAYPVENILGFGGMMLAGGVIALAAAPLLNPRHFTGWFTVYLAASMTLVAATLMEMAGIGPGKLVYSMLPGAAPEPATLFSLAGSVLVVLQVCVLGIVGLIAQWWQQRSLSTFQWSALATLLLGTILSAWMLLPGKPTSLIVPPLAASWSIALDSIRDPRSALIGVGSGSYTSAYQRFKPVWVNTTPLSPFIFSFATNVPLTLLTTTGFLGLITWLTLAGAAIKATRQSLRTDITVTALLVATFALQLVLPPNPVILGIQAIVLAYFIAMERREAGVVEFNFFHGTVKHDKAAVDDTRPTPRSLSPRWPLYLTSAALSLGIVIAFLQLGSFYLASASALQSRRAAEANDGLGVYSALQASTVRNNFSDDYRRRFASTTMTIAELMFANEEKSAQDEQTITSLIQQAVQHARIAQELDPLDAQNHALLGGIYQRLIGAIEGADTFAIQSYVQAINLFPSNPDFYISLASIYFQTEKFPQAIGVLEQAAAVKPDYANTYFNLGYGLEQLQQWASAKSAYEQTRQLIADQDSAEVAMLNEKISQLDALIATSSAQATPSAMQQGGAQLPTDGQTGSTGEGLLGADGQPEQPTALDLTLNSPQGVRPEDNQDPVNVPQDAFAPESQAGPAGQADQTGQPVQPGQQTQPGQPIEPQQPDPAQP